MLCSLTSPYLPPYTDVVCALNFNNIILLADQLLLVSFDCSPVSS